MKLILENYKNQLDQWPKSGQHILAQYDDKEIVVYQSYRPEIGYFAAKNQYFGGAFSLDRMTWIKPNFLWMMYRNGWGTKAGQEVVLAIHLKREAFERYASQAIHSSFQPSIYENESVWKEKLTNSDVRLQWDPDHTPHGAKETRRAIQLGVRNACIRSYAKDDVLLIEDISEFVREQGELVRQNRLDELMIPAEKCFVFEDESINRHLGIDLISK